MQIQEAREKIEPLILETVPNLPYGQISELREKVAKLLVETADTRDTFMTNHRLHIRAMAHIVFLLHYSIAHQRYLLNPTEIEAIQDSELRESIKKALTNGNTET